MNYRNDLQSARSLAMIFVYFFHKKNKKFKGGFIGVDIFFTLSGYFITGSLIRRLKINNHYLISFYKDRILRLQPMSNFVLIIVYISSLFNSFVTYKRAKEILSCLYSYANYYFYYISVSYFEQSNKLDINPLLHYWSLSIENQFYIVWPYAIKFLAGGFINYNFLILFIITFCLSMFICNRNVNYAYFAFEVRLCELIFGSYIEIIHYPNFVKYQMAYDAIIIFMWTYSSEKCSLYNYPNYNMIYPLFTSFLILFQENNSNSIFCIKILQYIGKLSYSFYLIHYPLISYYSRISFYEVIIVSLLCYLLIENFFVKLNTSCAKTYTFSTFCILFFTYLLLKSIKKHTFHSKYKKECKSMYAKDKILTSTCKCFERTGNYVLKNAYILLLGDSHLEQWNTILLPLYNAFHMKIIMFIFWINSFVNNKYLKVEKLITVIGNPFFIVECFYFSLYIERKYYNIIDNQLFQNYKSFNIFLSKRTNNIIIIVDNPSLLFSPKVLYTSNKYGKQSYCVINTECLIDRQTIIYANNIYYINLTSHYCNSSICYLYKDGFEIYSDKHHLTDCFVYYMEKYIYGELNKVKMFKNKKVYKQNNRYMINVSSSCCYLDEGFSNSYKNHCK